MRNTNLLRAAMTSLLAAGAASVATQALAEENREQCAGVIKAGYQLMVDMWAQRRSVH